MVTKKQMTYIMTEGKRIVSDHKYPHDTLITVSHQTNYSIVGKTVYKELSLPFVHPTNDDSTMFFKITFSDLKIKKLLISTGMRFKEIN